MICVLPSKEIRTIHTASEKYSVKAIDPKYAAVNGSLGVEMRC
jgi:hypothetical protein